MAVFKCKMCGGTLDITAGTTVATCEYCGTQQTVPSADDDKKIALFTRANRLRANNEFDKASGIYESIIADFPEEAEAYWGLVLCKYGVEYVDDPATGKKIPTCHRSSFESVMDDNDVELTLEYADAFAKRVYREEVKQLEEIRKGIIEVSSKEEPYDIFICYKETDEHGDRTIDSVLAQDIYEALTEKGYRTFFAKITLEDKLGQEYEPYIFAALNTAKIMLAVGTSFEHYDAVWVKNEWSRYLKLMANDKTKHLIPCFKNLDAYDMPKEFAKLQAQDLGKVGATQDLLRGIEKILPKQKVETVKEVVKETVVSKSGPDTSSLLERAFMFLEDGNWASANEYCEKVLDIEPKNAQAYLGKLMCDLEVKKQEELKEQRFPFDANANYQKAIKYADKTLKEVLIGYIESIKPIPDGTIVIDRDTLRGYTKLTSITIPNSVTTIDEGAFNGLKNLTNITIPNSVTKIGYQAFECCSGLLSITIPDSVTTIGDMAFSKCTSLTSVTIPDSIISIGEMVFEKCKNLASVTIPNSVTTIGDFAFSDCTSLTKITIPNSVTSIGEYAFSDCTSLTKITIPNSVTSIGEYAFYGCTNLTSVTIGNGVTEISEYTFAFCDNLTSVKIGNSVTEIGECAFRNCESLTNIEIPSNVKTIYGRALYSGAFIDCPFVDVRRKQGVCMYCGGSFKGLFSKTCEKCGRKKDY